VRILSVTHFFESHGGGIERVAGQVCRELAGAGHGCIWVASRSDPAPDLPGVEAVPIPCLDPVERLTGLPMPIPTPAGLRALAGAVRRADAVVVHDALYVSSIAATILARRAGKPVLLVQHIGEIPFASRVLRGAMALATRMVTRPMLRAADQAVFISAAVRDRFAGIAFRAPPRLLFNGVDRRIFRPGGAEGARAELRARLGLAEGQRLVAFVGRLVSKKGLSVLREVARLRPDLVFAVAGAGPIDPAAWGLANVRTLGAIGQAEVADLLRAADLFLLPSVGEGYPLVVQEALACGTPVVCGLDSAAADPGATQWLTGVEIDLAAPEVTARRVVACIDSAARDPEARAAAAAYAARHYDWQALATGIAAALQKRVTS
jgi:glycosyltransferase involved in cell wall biosynthesis